MITSTQAFIKRLITTAKTAVRAISRIMSPVPNAMPANCVNINALLMHLCDFDEHTYRFIIKWLAYPVQNSGAKMQYALMMNGPQGTGASMFFMRVVARMYRDQGRVVDSMYLGRHFNEWASDARFVVIDGPLPRQAVGKVKSLVSSDIVIIEQQAAPMRVEDNHMNLVLLTHSEEFLPRTSADRRYFTVEAPPPREQAFYKAVAAEISNGGIEAFHNQLMNVDLAGFDQFSEPPRLAATRLMEAA